MLQTKLEEEKLLNFELEKQLTSTQELLDEANVLLRRIQQKKEGERSLRQ